MITHAVDKDGDYICNKACCTTPEKIEWDNEEVTCKNCKRIIKNEDKVIEKYKWNTHLTMPNTTGTMPNFFERPNNTSHLKITTVIPKKTIITFMIILVLLGYLFGRLI